MPTEMTPPREVYFFRNGNTAFLDGAQVPELQRPWILLYVEFLVSKGVDPLGIVFRLPDGKNARVFKTSEGFNWEFL